MSFQGSDTDRQREKKGAGRLKGGIFQKPYSLSQIAFYLRKGGMMAELSKSANVSMYLWTYR